MSKLIGLKSAPFLMLLSAAAAASAQPVAIALSGAPAPGTGAGVFGAFTNPVLNAGGEVAFAASVTGGTSTSGVFTGTSASTPQAVALQGTAAPAGGNYGTLFSSSTSTSTTLSANGTLAFQSPLTGGTSTSGIFAGTSAATLQSVALQATAAPSGGNYSAFAATGTNAATSPVINSTGQVAFSSTLTGGSNASGLFVGTPGSLQTVALLGTAAPTTPSGNYATALTAPVVNSSGQVAFVSLVNSAQGVFFGSPGSVVAAAYGGSPVGGTYGSISSYFINNAGQVSVQSTITGGSATGGIFVGTPGSTLQTVALIGGTAPGTGGGTFSVLSSQTLNGAGQVAFTGTVSGGTATTGLFLGSSSSNVQAVALVGGTSPDGATYSSFGSTELTNANGEVAFLANLSGTGITTGVNSEELVAGMPGNLTVLAREGDVVGGLTVNGFGLLTGSGGQDGKGTIFNDLNEVAYRLTFTDGSTGVFESVVPEPTSLGLIGLGAGLLVRRARRRSH